MATCAALLYPLVSNLSACNADMNVGTGPTACSYAFGGISLAPTINGYAIPPGIQTWVVPTTGTYMLVAAGAAGAAYSTFTPGYGIVVSNTYTFQAGQIVVISVGQMPYGCQSFGFGPGGGGTTLSMYAAAGPFQSAAQHTPILVAGGGGGVGTGGTRTGVNGATATQGTLCICCTGPSNAASNGGGGGAGALAGGNAAAGASTATDYGSGAGGGGFYYGGGSVTAANYLGGSSFVGGPIGGIVSTTPTLVCSGGLAGAYGSPNGGWGGGGASSNAGGGGGGYSGGQAGGSGNRCGGGGGGSYDASNAAGAYAATQYTTWNTTLLGPAPATFAAGYNTGAGFVYIVPLTNCSFNGCTPCPAGTYAPIAALSTCTLCPANSQAGAGASACAPSAGYFGPALRLWDGATPSLAANLGTNQSLVLRTPAPQPAFGNVLGQVAPLFDTSLSGGYVTLENPYGALTVMFWVYVNTLPAVISDLFCLRDTNASTGSLEGANFDLNPSGQLNDYVFYGATATSTSASNAPTSAIATGAWVHLAYVIASSARTLLYMNGALAATPSILPGTLWNYQVLAIAMDVRNNRAFKGSLRDFRVYPTAAFTDAQIGALYANSAAPYVACANLTGCVGVTRCTANGTAVCCAVGTAFVDGVSAACTPCPTGTFFVSNVSGTCIPCAPGYYSGLVGASACTACASGSLATAAGATACTVCGAGTGTLLNCSAVPTYNRISVGACNADRNLGTGPTACNYTTNPIGNLSLASAINGYAIPQGIQTWTVGATGTYLLVAAGAAGASYAGYPARIPGSGVVVSNTYTFQAGQTVVMAVGQTPYGCGSNGFPTGGGGTFLSLFAGTGAFQTPTQHTPILVAGGGGSVGAVNGMNAVLTTSGTLSSCGSGAVASNGGGGGGGGASGGTNAPGTSINSIGYSAGGGGFYYKGGDAYAGNTLGGAAFVSATGPVGGQSAGAGPTGVCGDNVAGITLYPNGGYGGGGGGWNAGAGGGGYSGGQGAVITTYCGGGGGGSYDATNIVGKNAATQYTAWNATLLGPAPPTFNAGYNNGSGFIYIVQLSNCTPGCAPCPAGTYAPLMAYSACTTCPAGAQSAAGASACTANAGYLGPTLHLFDGINPSYANLGSGGHNVTAVGFTPTFSNWNGRYAPYIASTGTGNYFTATNYYNQMTVTFWMYVSGTFNSAIMFQFEPTALRGQADVVGTSYTGFNFDLGTSSGKVGYFYFYANYGSTAVNSGTCNAVPSSSSFYVSAGQWYHVALVLPQSPNTRNQLVYLNGAFAGSCSTTSSSTVDVSNYQLFYIGADIADQRYFQGYIQGYSVYNSVLSATQIAALYSQPTYSPFVACAPVAGCVGATRCTPTGVSFCCLAGMYFVAGSTACTQCPPGSFATDPLATACQNCAPGSYSGAGYTACSLCVPPAAYLPLTSTTTQNLGSGAATVTQLGAVTMGTNVCDSGTSLNCKSAAYFTSAAGTSTYGTNHLEFPSPFRTPFTSTMWVRADSTAYYSLFGLKTAGTSTISLNVDFGSAGGLISVPVALPSTWTEVLSAASAYVATTWVHVAITVDSTSTGFLSKVYINGAQVAVNTPTTATGDIVNYNTVVVGSAADALRGFNGYMTQVGWFNYALTAAQITAVYRGTPASCHLAPQGSAFASATGLITVCPAGTACLGGTAAQQICGAGTYASAAGATTCLACGVGTYAQAGSSACVACQNNSQSLAGASACTVNAGYYDLGASLMAYYPFNTNQMTVDVSGRLGALTIPQTSPVADCTSAAAGPGGAWASSCAAATQLGGSLAATNAAAQYFQLPNVVLPASYSLCLWYQPTPAIVVNNEYVFMMAQTNLNTMFTMQRSSATGVGLGVANIYPGNANGAWTLSWPGSSLYFSSNTWYHACFTFSGTAYAFYMNGALTWSGTLSAAQDTTTPRNMARLLCGDVPCFQGKLDEVRLYNKALTAAEVTALYTFRGDTYTGVLSLPCAAGTYASAPGASACTQCAAGSFASAAGATACVQCAAGTYAAAVGASACANCSASQWSYAGYAQCYSNTYPIFALLAENAGSPGRYVDLGTAYVSSPSTLATLTGASAFSFDGAFALLSDVGNNVIRKVVFSTNTVTLLAGVAGSTGLVDGAGASAKFNYPFGVALSPDGTYALIADCANNAIRRMEMTTLNVVTFAGASCTSAGCTAGSANGAALSASSFNCPYSIDIYPSGTYGFVADRGSNLIRRIDFFPSVVVSTLTPVSGTFLTLSSAKLSSDGLSLLLADRGNHMIKTMSIATQVVTTVYTFSNDVLDAAWLGLSDGILMVDYFGSKVYSVTNPGGTPSTFAGSGTQAVVDGAGSAAQVRFPITINVWRCMIPGMGVDTNDYVCQRCSPGKYSNGFGLCVACPAGASSALGSLNASACFPCPAGTYAAITVGCLPCPANQWSYAGASACYNATYPVFALVTDWTGGTVRQVDLGTSAVSTLMTGVTNPAGATISPLGDYALVSVAGTNRIYRLPLTGGAAVVIAGTGGAGSADGIGTSAAFNSPGDIKLSPDGAYALITDALNYAVRKLYLSNFSVVRIAGTLSANYAEGSGLNIAFNYLGSLDISADGTFAIVTEYNGHRVRMLNLTGGAVTSSLVAGNAGGGSGSADGVGSFASFLNPQGVAISSDMTFAIVVDRGNNKLRKIVLSASVVSTLTTFAPAVTPITPAWAALQDAVYVAGLASNTLLRVVYPTGTYAAVAGSGAAGEVDQPTDGLLAQFNAPNGLAVWRCGVPGMGVDTNNAVCQRCPAGKYASTGRCVACPVGTYGPAIGASACAACAFATSTGNTQCLVCPAGAYAFNGTACVSCPAGSSSSQGATTCTVNATAYYDLGASLMAYYPFLAGSPYADATGRLGSLVGSGPLPSATVVPYAGGSSLGFASQTIGVPSLTLPDPYTVCFYVYHTTTPIVSGGGPAIFQFAVTPTASPWQSGDWSLFYVNGYNENTYRFREMTGASFMGDLFTPANSALTATWVHYCMAWSGQRGSIWTNGQPTVVNAAPTGGTLATRAIKQYTMNFLGSTNWGNTALANGNLLNGYLDEFMVFNKALSDAEVRAVYALQSTTGLPVIPVACANSSGVAACSCAAGQYPYGGACVACPNGTASINGTACVNCTAGAYASAVGGTTCLSCSGGSYASMAGASACGLCAAGTYSVNGTGCQGCVAGAYSTAGATVCTTCAAGTFSTAIGQPAAATPAPLTWLMRNNATGVYYINFTLQPQSSWFAGGVGGVPGITYYQGYPIASTLQLGMTQITLATLSRSSCVATDQLVGADGTYAQICNGNNIPYDIGGAGECNGAGQYASMNLSLTPFGIQSSYITASGTMTLSCPSATYCSFRAISTSGNCYFTCFTGKLDVLNSTWFNSDITQACALYKASAGKLVCAGNENVTYVGASPCAACAAGAYATGSGLSACATCAAGAYVAQGKTTCTTCPNGTNSTPSSEGQWAAPLALASAQYSASTTSVATAYALNGAGMWVATLAEYVYQRAWLQMDLLAVLPVRAVVTQGGSATAYVRQIRVDVSSDGASFATVASLLQANSDASTLVTNPIATASGGTVWARYVRLYVLGYYQTPGLRASVLLGTSG